MNILFIIPNFKIKGSHVPMARIASQLSTRKDVNVFIYNIHPDQDPPKDYSLKTMISSDVKIIYNIPKNLALKTKGLPLIGRLIGRVRDRLTKMQLNYIIKGKRIDVINSHAYLADLFVYNNQQSFNSVARVSTWHGCYESTYNELETKKKERFKNELIRTFNTSFDAIINVSEKQKKYIEEVFKLKTPTVKKIYYGIDTENSITKTKPDSFIKLQQQLADNELIFGMVSANAAAKGWEELIVSFISLKKTTVKKIALVLIGGQELFKDYKEKYPTEDIFYLDKVDNPLLYMELFHVGVLPSYYPAENLPNVIIEYLLSGLPVISTQWAEIPYMIEMDGHIAGEIIPLVDGKPRLEHLQKAMLKYIEDPLKEKKESILAKAIVKQKFCIQSIADAYMQLFEELIQK